MICEQCALAADLGLVGHCNTVACSCQHEPRRHGQLSVKRIEAYEEKKAVDEIVADVLRKYVDRTGESPFVSPNLVICHVCTKKVNLTRVGRVMHWHKDNRFTMYGKHGMRCPGSGKAPK